MFRTYRKLAEIQSSFTQAVEDLKNLRSRNEESINGNQIRIQLLELQNTTLSAENQKAEKFQANIEALLS